MAQEIERKFLVTDEVLPLLGNGTEYRQGYLAQNDLLAVRVRVAGEKAWLTVKGAGSGGKVPVRPEFEYVIPEEDARNMLALVSDPIIHKTRYLLQYGGNTWEVDVFAAANAGLLVAEIELNSADQEFDLPPWVGQEVTDDVRYLNVNLVKNPFSQW